MVQIKLDAIDSTNEFLKALSSHQTLDNFTVVTAENQTKGKGQMGNTWFSEPSKNLIMSILLKEFELNNHQLFSITFLTSVSMIQALKPFLIPELSIKWPNDIMSYDKKIGGILIENILKPNDSILSIVGIGLNVNQTNFEHLPHAASLATICKTDFDRDQLVKEIVKKLEFNFSLWKENSSLFYSEYCDFLFKKNIPMPFVNPNNEKFMGIIQGVSEIGKIKILLEDDSIAEFDIKEVQMLY